MKVGDLVKVKARVPSEEIELAELGVGMIVKIEERIPLHLNTSMVLVIMWAKEGTPCFGRKNPWHIEMVSEYSACN